MSDLGMPEDIEPEEEEDNEESYGFGYPDDYEDDFEPYYPDPFDFFDDSDLWEES